MSTFSQIIDEMMTELVRPDLVSMLPSFLNQAIRECHNDTDGQALIRFGENRKEADVTTSSVVDNVYLWAIPATPRFQAIEAVYYPKFGVYAAASSPLTMRTPSLARPNDRFSYYRSGPYFAMKGFGQEGDRILISWFEYPKSLKYYYPANRAPSGATPRPLEYDVETEVYTQPSGATMTLAEAKDLTTNWIIERHTEMLKEGVRAKAYKRMGDEFRANLAYGQFKQLLTGMQSTEQAQPEVYFHR